MQPVTTGPGISGAFADTLGTLVLDLRAKSKDQGWRLYIQITRRPEYFLRVYAPDGHTEGHTVKGAKDTEKDIRQILLSETELWRLRIRAAAAANIDELSVRTSK